jgi:Trm5-related predicted tRNA methylase
VTKEGLIKQIDESYDMIEKMKYDKNLRLVYSDFDFYKYIDRCRERLRSEYDIWECVDDISNPFLKES